MYGDDNWSVKCWGTNGYGRLGAADTAATKATVLLPAGEFATVSVGGTHSCAVTSNAVAYCWRGVSDSMTVSEQNGTGHLRVARVRYSP